jgi:hypothetical protein
MNGKIQLKNHLPVNIKKIEHIQGVMVINYFMRVEGGFW